MMNRKKLLPVLSVGGALLLAAVLYFALASPGRSAAAGSNSLLGPVGTGITYQGYLEDGGSPANGTYDFEFVLYDAANAGVQVGSTSNVGDANVVDGLFTVKLDFGTAVFGGGARWLQIGVRPGNSGGAYTPLTPRQELTPAPYALGMPNVFVNEAANFVGIGRDFAVSNNEVFGVRYDGAANDYGGMYVETAHPQGWPFYGYATDGAFHAWTYYNGSTNDRHLYNAAIRLTVPNEGGLRIGPSADYSLVITNTTGSDAIRIYDTSDDGSQIGSDPDYPNYGVYIPSPGVGNYGLWPNTSEPAGEWALFTVDKIEASNVLASAYSLVAQVTGEEALTAGDVVAVSSVTDPIPGSTVPLPLVRLADGAESGVIGVVEKRMVWAVAPGKEDEGEMSLQSAEGPAEPGDYVWLTIYGIAQVKVDPAGGVTTGARVTAASLPGHVRALQTRTIEGMVVTEGAQVIGIALETPTAGQTTIPVFITLR